ncbi:MAG: 16S rRNA (cytosine(967)-C(5))-methyltransferase RsmB [Myxococcota bacterium]
MTGDGRNTGTPPSGAPRIRKGGSRKARPRGDDGQEARPPRRPNARQLALDVLIRVDRDDAYADRALDAGLRRGAGLEERDRGLATELVYGTLRHSIHIDFILEQLATKPLSKARADVRNALRMGAHQILNMRIPTHAAVNETVALVRHRHRGATGFVNALLRKVAALADNGELPEPDGALKSLATLGSHPMWLLQEVERRLGEEEVGEFVAANNQTPPLMLRANSVRTSRDALADALTARGMAVNVPPYLADGLEVRDAGHITELEEFNRGECSAQDFAAQLVGLLVAPMSGAAVLDACAAPGGKSCHVAELMGDEGLVVAADIHPGRTGLIGQNAERLGLTTVRPIALDTSDGEALAQGLSAADHPDAYDRVIVDAPCSGMGTLRRHPELRMRKKSELASLVKLQGKILDAVAPRVKVGGRLVYSVCTITEREGIEQARGFLNRHSEFKATFPNDPQLQAMRKDYGALPTLETWPHRHGTDGFFAAVFERVR